MTNKRYYLLLLVCSLTVIIVAAIWKYPDAVKAHEARGDEKLGEYVYLDRHNVVHASRKCSRLNYKTNRSERIKLDDVSRLDGIRYKSDRNRLDAIKYESITFCPKCVSDKDYDILSQKVQCKE